MMRFSSLFLILFACSDSILCQTVKEDFNDFIYKFVLDSTYQLQRIKFPLEFRKWESDEFDSVETTWISAEKWNYDQLYLSMSARPQFYDNFEAKLRETDERVVAWEGVENGINIKYYFKRITGRWYLIKKEDFST